LIRCLIRSRIRACDSSDGGDNDAFEFQCTLLDVGARAAVA
jgi:hypothetical protein